jgi:predicted permease
MDLRFAIRSLVKNPGFTVVAVLVMALGIGANTAMFSVVNAVLLRPLAYRDADRIVKLRTMWKKDGSGNQVSAPDFHDWHDQSTAFEAMANYQNFGETAVSIGPAAEYAMMASVSSEFFDVFSIQPAIGRLFSPEEFKPKGSAAVLISDSYWRSHFGGNTDVLGKTVRMFDRSLNIVGVLPPGFHFPEKTDIWTPINTIFPETVHRTAHNYLVVAKLKPDVTLEQAQTQMTAIADRLEQQYFSNTGKSCSLERLQDSMVSKIKLTLYLMLGAVGVVLLIACANMANLLLAKATSRVREIAIRAAVGASRGRIIRQLITESLLLSLIAGAAGVILAIWGADALVSLAPQNLPRLGETVIDDRVLGFTFAMSVLASLIFGLAPALSASRVDLNHSLKQGGTRAVVGGGAGKLRNVLVVAEVALSVVLLAGAGLLIKSFAALHNVTLGFRPESILLMTSSVPASDLEGSKKATRFYKGLLEDVRSMPGVISAGATFAPPGDTRSNGGYFLDHAPDFDKAAVPNTPQAVFSLVTPGTFATLQIPIRSGRDFNDTDVYDAPFTVIVNEALVRKSFPGQDPIGRIMFCGFDSATPPPMRIIGIVGDVRQLGPATPPSPEIYMPYQQHPRPSSSLSLLVRTASSPTSLSEAIRRKVHERQPDVPVKFSTMEAYLSKNVATPRFRTLLLSIFAALAVALAMAGVYGVMAYTVGQRSNEIGLRMALGASSNDVVRMVLGQGAMLAGIGMVLGLVGAVAATRLLESVLFEVKPFDPLTYAAVAALVVVIALAASYLPARRASQLDPLEALRQE